jgi:hypothetical protein
MANLVNFVDVLFVCLSVLPPNCGGKGMLALMHQK